MKESLLPIFRAVAEGRLTQAEALVRIKALKRQSRDPGQGVLLADVQWTPAPARASAAQRPTACCCGAYRTMRWPHCRRSVAPRSSICRRRCPDRSTWCSHGPRCRPSRRSGRCWAPLRLRGCCWSSPMRRTRPSPPASRPCAGPRWRKTRLAVRTVRVAGGHRRRRTARRRPRRILDGVAARRGSAPCPPRRRAASGTRALARGGHA